MPTRSMGTISVEADLCITLSTGVGVIGVLEITLIVPTLRVGMPLRTLRVRSRTWRSDVALAPAFSTPCTRLTESAVCAICDAERHERHASAEHWHDHSNTLSLPVAEPVYKNATKRGTPAPKNGTLARPGTRDTSCNHPSGDTRKSFMDESHGDQCSARCGDGHDNPTIQPAGDAHHRCGCPRAPDQ